MEHIKESLERYVEHKIPTGGFLEAVLSNNLADAVGKADNENIQRLPEIVRFVYTKLPSSCWGSPEKVKEWLNS